MKKRIGFVVLAAIVTALPTAALAYSSAPVTSMVTVTTTGPRPVVTGATYWNTSPVSGTIGTVNVSNSPTSCAITGGDGNYTIALNNPAPNATGCTISHTGSLTGAGFHYLTVTATNNNGTSMPVLVDVQWRTWSTGSPASTAKLNIIPDPAGFNVVFPASTTFPLPVNTIFGRVATDSTAGAPGPTSCLATGDSRFKAVPSGVGYHCIIEANTSITTTSGGPVNLTITATNANGAGTSAVIPVTWSQLAAGAPVVSQANFAVKTPAGSGTMVGIVPVTNTPTSCALNGDPGSPTPFFTIAPVTTPTVGCQITLNTNVSGNLGSPVLYVTATNGSGMSIGNYVVVAMGPTDPSPPTPASTWGYTLKTVNDTTMATSQLDTTSSSWPSTIIHYYGNSGNFPGPYNPCDSGIAAFTSFACDYADLPSFFDTSLNDQSADNLNGAGTTRVINVSSGVLNLQAPAGGIKANTCDQFGMVPYNGQFPIAGHAFAGGFYLDVQAKIPTANAGNTSTNAGIYSLPLQGFMNQFIQLPTSNTNAVEVDFVESGFGGGYCFWVYNTAAGQNCPSRTGGYDGTQIPTDGAFHHFQVLFVPSTRNAGTGFTTFYIDGVQKTNQPYTSSTTPEGLALDTQYSCIFLQPYNTWTLNIGSIQIWQHP